ncbi:3-hexulose-6-phosphate synthase [Lederbergia citrea]|uniref:3-hexulose-6-phosphate synthase n=1 Tax=Lederbergia citrea TaxID=2833581 RepID=A0A942Z2R2_9BACI|nr:3-hexulose-6-phosphate synthase [Lederbergia citrea]MBS4221744.1 3-hexulose-6-phosphate synthase [Lederbergia citrea]
MKLQVALDLVDIPEAINILENIHEYVDIVEIGTPFIINYGLKAVNQIKEAFPHLKVLADLKIMDAGEYETMKALEAGADIVTVLAVSDDLTIKASIDEAKKLERCVMIDMINVENIKNRAKKMDLLGADYICVHIGTDLQTTGKSPLDELKQVKSVITRAKVAVAGGIKFETLADIIEAKPDVIIVGSGITRKEDMKKATLDIKNLINQGG